MARNIVRLACLAVAFSLAAGLARGQDRRQNQPGEFDFYVLALSWSPSFCEAAGERGTPPRQQCGARPYSFVVHGLWPQYEKGFPEFCRQPAPRLDRSIVSGMLDLMPSARVGHVGLYRDPHTLEPVEYYYKVPDDVHERLVIVADPMLATGNSASAALWRLKEDGVASLKFVCLLAAPEGLATLARQHPDVPVTTAAIDSHLDEHGYIVPGLGDAGDRLFGTR